MFFIILHFNSILGQFQVLQFVKLALLRKSDYYLLINMSDGLLKVKNGLDMIHAAYKIVWVCRVERERDKERNRKYKHFATFSYFFLIGRYVCGDLVSFHNVESTLEL